MADLTVYFFILLAVIMIYGYCIMDNQKYIFKKYEKDYTDYLNYLRQTQSWVYEHNAQSAKNDDKIINRLDNISYGLDKGFSKNHKLLTAADRGKIDEIILALTTLGQEKMINYDEEINFLNNIRKW